MSDIIQRVNHILKTKGELSNNFGELSKIYLMTTENIKGFLQKYDLQDKEVLTVAGSGDQMLNAYLMGARNVTCFDINPLAFYQVKLKKAAICALSYEEFLYFFFHEFQNDFMNEFLCYELFEKIIPMLDDESVKFWNYFYSSYAYTDDFYQKIYYYRFQSRLEHMQRMNAYLDKDNYKKLAGILKEKEVSFIESDITNLRGNLEKKTYDMILLSNISDSVQDIWSNDSLKNFKRLIHLLSKNLKENGVIQVGYIYDYYFKEQYHLFRKNEERNAIFTSDEFQTTFVQSYRFQSESDAVVSFQKKKRKS